MLETKRSTRCLLTTSKLPLPCCRRSHSSVSLKFLDKIQIMNRIFHRRLQIRAKVDRKTSGDDDDAEAETKRLSLLPDFPNSKHEDRRPVRQGTAANPDRLHQAFYCKKFALVVNIFQFSISLLQGVRMKAMVEEMESKNLKDRLNEGLTPHGMANFRSDFKHPAEFFDDQPMPVNGLVAYGACFSNHFQ